MLLSLHTGFSFIRAAVACAFHMRTYSSMTITPRYLKPVTAPSSCVLTLISPWMPLGLFVISLVFSALISSLHLVQNYRDFQQGLLVLLFLQNSVNIINKRQIGNSSVPYVVFLLSSLDHMALSEHQTISLSCNR